MTLSEVWRVVTGRKEARGAPAHAPVPLTAEQEKFWDDNGYLVLRAAISPEDVQTIRDLVDHEWDNRTENDHLLDILSGPDVTKSVRLSEARTEHRREVYKLNNLFLRRPQIRRIALSPVIKGALRGLLDGEPLICNSLNFERGSQQPFHLDTWYMPPPVDGMMVAANIALDPMTSENGPFIYYPGSHKIPPYRFSDGRLNMTESEGAACVAYIQSEIERRSLHAEAFSCQPGDVFLWHAQLFHGGSPIKCIDRTRNSLVVHYWRTMDLQADQIRTDDSGSYLGFTLRGEISA